MVDRKDLFKKLFYWLIYKQYDTNTLHKKRTCQYPVVGDV